MSYPYVQTAPAHLGSGGNRPNSRAWHTANPQATSPRKSAAKGPRGVRPKARKGLTHQHKSDYYRTAIDAQDVASKVDSNLAHPPRKEPEYQVNIVEIPRSQPEFCPVAKYEKSPAIYLEEISPTESPGEVEQQPQDSVEHVLWAGSNPVPPTNPVQYYPLGHTAVLSSSSITTWEDFNSHPMPPGFYAIPTPPIYEHGGDPRWLSGLPQDSIDSSLRNNRELTCFSSTFLDSTSFCQAWPLGAPQNTGQFNHPEAEPSAATTEPFVHPETSTSFVEAHGLPTSIPQRSFGQYAMHNSPTPVFHPQLQAASLPLSEIRNGAAEVPLPFPDSQLALSGTTNAFAASQPEYAAGGAWTSWGQDINGQNAPDWYQPGIKSEKNDLDLPRYPVDGHVSQGPPHFSAQSGGLLPFQPWTGPQELVFPPTPIEASVIREPNGMTEASRTQHALNSMVQRPHAGVPPSVDHGENIFHESVEASRQIFPKPDPEMAQVLPTSEDEALKLCVPSRQIERQQAVKLSTPESVKPRKPFLEDDRKETSRTRDIGACVRCKMQRVRCRPNPPDPDGPCLGCFKVANNKSRKVIHHIGCHRYKLQEITLFRSTATQVTRRWQGSQVRDIPTVGEPSSVRLVQGAEEALWIRIAKFTPKKDLDKTARIFCPPEDLGQKQPVVEKVGEYVLLNVQQAREDYKSYLARNWYREFARTCQKEMKEEPAGLVSRVYSLAQAHHDSLPVAPKWDFYRPSGENTWDPKTLPERSFLAGTLLMCFVLRQATGYSWIESLDVEAKGLEMERHRQFGPLRDRYGAPRLVVAQLDCIRITCVLRSLAKPLLKVLTTWIAERRHGCWLSIFFASFIFLREISVATSDAYEHGRFNPKYRKLENPIQPNHPTVISEMHESANIILAHWHYFNCSVDPETLEEKARAKSPLRELTAEQFETVKGVWQKARLQRADAESRGRNESHEDRPARNDRDPEWCHPLYFAEQMFVSDWRPRKVFTGQGIDWKKVQRSDDETVS